MVYNILILTNIKYGDEWTILHDQMGWAHRGPKLCFELSG